VKETHGGLRCLYYCFECDKHAIFKNRELFKDHINLHKRDEVIVQQHRTTGLSTINSDNNNNNSNNNNININININNNNNNNNRVRKYEQTKTEDEMDLKVGANWFKWHRLVDLNANYIPPVFTITANEEKNANEIKQKTPTVTPKLLPRSHHHSPSRYSSPSPPRLSNRQREKQDDIIITINDDRDSTVITRGRNQSQKYPNRHSNRVFIGTREQQDRYNQMKRRRYDYTDSDSDSNSDSHSDSDRDSDRYIGRNLVLGCIPMRRRLDQRGNYTQSRR
jgi:hypothetical protein